MAGNTWQKAVVLVATVLESQEHDDGSWPKVFQVLKILDNAGLLVELEGDTLEQLVAQDIERKARFK